MAWGAKGDDRVKSYRLYQELERNYHALLTEAEALKTALRIKDELIRRLAAEIAMIPNRQEYGQEAQEESVRHLHQVAADAWSKNVELPSGERRASSATAGSYSQSGSSVTQEGGPKSGRVSARQT